MNLSGAGDTAEGRDAIQRDLDKLEIWVYVNLTSFNKAKRKVLHLSQGNARYEYRLRELTERRPVKNLGSWWTKSGREPEECSCSLKVLYPGLHQQKGSSRVRERDCPPLLYPH